MGEIRELSDAELGRRYLALREKFRPFIERIHLAKLACSCRLSPETVTQLREARAACAEDPILTQCRIEITQCRTEIVRRLNTPLKSVRLARSLSQGEVAKRAGLSRKCVQQIESGQYRASVS